ncbi:hypothetical protein BGX26_003513 [Mortierella sp. AD094]|nr:hypothetical protein BGX26_003513 [Mortierella sp. AD094]
MDVMKNAPGWDALNATESEADVKADRERYPKNMKQLQEETIKIMNESIDGRPIRRATVEISPIFGMDISVEEVVGDFTRRAQTRGAKLGKVKRKLEDFEQNIEGSPIFGV